MRLIILMLVLLFFSFRLCAQDTINDSEQRQLALCYQYSQLLGTCVDSLPQEELFQTIYDWLGSPYKYSGNERDGIDCSGFVSMLYKKIYNIELAESSLSIYKESKSVMKKKMQIGDLVFFKIKKKRVSHVGIYIGHNKFAHASVQQGVIISDLDEPYYRKYFFKAGSVK